MTTQGLTASALKLPPKNRARLAARLLESIDTRKQSKIDTIWVGEIEARIGAFDAAPVKTIPAAEVLAYKRK